MPLFVLVEFDDYHGPTINGAVPITPVENCWISNNSECKRTQLPLTIVYSIRHKSQGTSLDRAVISLGETELQLGLSYVALSRVRTLNGVAQDKEYDFSRFANIANSVLLALRLAEEIRLMSIAF